jgi:hypothetical protein
LPEYCKGSRVALGRRVARLFGLWWIAVLTKNQTTIVELKMEFKALIVLVVIVGIAFFVYRIVMKKIDKWEV